MTAFGAQARAALAAQGLSIRQAARQTAYDPSYVARVLRGDQPPSSQLAHALDDLLSADGHLVLLAEALTGDGADRMTGHANGHRLDAQSVGAYAAVLAAQRRLDDSVGAAPLVASVDAQTVNMERRLKEARGQYRDHFADVVAESLQFSGWCYAGVGCYGRADGLLRESLALAQEIGSGELAAQAHNFMGYTARRRGRFADVVTHFGLAYDTPGAHPAQRMGDAAQVAQGLGMLGQRDEGLRWMDRATALLDVAAGDPPGTAYWLGPAFQRLNLGLGCLGLGAYDDAADHLSSGLRMLPAEWQSAPWSAEHKDALREAEERR